MQALSKEAEIIFETFTYDLSLKEYQKFNNQKSQYNAVHARFIDKKKDFFVYQISHESTFNGELMFDPKFIFLASTEGVFVASYESSYLDEEKVGINKSGDLFEKIQAEISQIAEIWLKSIKIQQNLILVEE